MAINVMPVDGTASAVNYGGGLVWVFTPGQQPAGVDSINYDLLQAFAVQMDADGGYYKVRCERTPPVCAACTGGACGGPPPPPAVPPVAPKPPDNSTNVAFRKAPDLQITDDRIDAANAMGPIWVRPWDGDAPTDVSALLADATTWLEEVGTGGIDLMLHLYNVIDPNGTHPLHQTTVGIPALPA
jgi:hypothetical protein